MGLEIIGISCYISRCYVVIIRYKFYGQFFKYYFSGTVILILNTSVMR